MGTIAKNPKWDWFYDDAVYTAFNGGVYATVITSPKGYASDEVIAARAVSLTLRAYERVLRRKYGKTCDAEVASLSSLEFFQVGRISGDRITINHKLIDMNYVFDLRKSYNNMGYDVALRYSHSEMGETGDLREIKYKSIIENADRGNILTPDTYQFKVRHRNIGNYLTHWKQTNEGAYLGAIKDLELLPRYVLKRLVLLSDKRKETVTLDFMFCEAVERQPYRVWVFRQDSPTHIVYALEYNALGLRLLVDVKLNDKYAISLRDVQFT